MKITILVLFLAINIGAPAFAQTPPATPTELDLNLLNLDGSSIDTSRLLTIDYYDSSLNLRSTNSLDDPDVVIWDLYKGKSNLYSMLLARDGTDIKVTVYGYEPITVTAAEDGYVNGTYYLNNITQIPQDTTTTVSTTVPPTTTTLPPDDADVKGPGEYEPTPPGISVSVVGDKIVMSTPTIESGSSATFTVPPSEDMPIRQLDLEVARDVTDVEVTINVLTEKPAQVETTTDVVTYRYIDISHTASDAEISSATLKFNVEKSWIYENGVGPGRITLDRYFDGKWNALSTKMISDEPDYYAYEAISPGLSIFRISGPAVAEAQVTTTTTAPSPVETSAAITGGIGIPVTTMPPETKKPVGKALFIILGLAVAALAAYYHLKR